MTTFFYIYILQSERDAGRVLHTAKWRPWRLKAYVALSDRVRAAAFERYLKSASGRAFVKNHL